MKEISIIGKKREELGKKASKQLRKEGFIPCNIYGEQKDANGKPVAMAFAASFNELRKLGKAVALPKTDDGIYLCGAADGNGKAALMISNISGEPWEMDFSFGKYKVTEVRLLDDGHLNDTIDSVPGFLGNWSVCLLLLEKGMTPTSAGL